MNNEILRTIESLQSTHGDFDERRLSPETLETILESSTRAATASAIQDYSIIVLDDQELMRELTGYSGSHALVFCADGNRLRRAASLLGHSIPERTDMATFLTWCADAFLAAQTACIAARSLGVDSLFTNGLFRKGTAKAFEALNLPERDCFPLITLILGYASRKAERKTERYGGRGLVHYGAYRELTAEETMSMIAEYDDPGRRLGMGADFRAHGCAHYVDWLFGKWLSRPEAGAGYPEKERMAASGFL